MARIDRLRDDAHDAGMELVGTEILTLHEQEGQKRVQVKCEHEWGEERPCRLDRKVLTWCQRCGALKTERPSGALTVRRQRRHSGAVLSEADALAAAALLVFLADGPVEAAREEGSQ